MRLAVFLNDIMVDKWVRRQTFHRNLGAIINVLIFVPFFGNLHLLSAAFTHPSQSSIPVAQLQLYTSQQHHENGVSIDPISLFNADIERVASLPSPKSAQRAELMLNQMRDLYQAGSRTIRPNRETYIIVIHAHGELIKRLRSCNSKGLTSTVVINAVQRATALHNELWDLYNEDPLLNSLLKPDAATYNAVLNVLAQASGCPGDKRYSYPRTLINNTYDSNYTITQPFDPKINGSTNNVSFAELSEMIVAQIEKGH
jgi:hypothetical protein